MILVAPIQHRHEGTGIQKRRSRHLPNPSMCFGLLARSPGPVTQPIHGSAASSADVGTAARSPSRYSSSAARMTCDLLHPCICADRSNFLNMAAGSLSDTVFMSAPPVLPLSTYCITKGGDRQLAAGGTADQI